MIKAPLYTFYIGSTLDYTGGESILTPDTPTHTPTLGEREERSWIVKEVRTFTPNKIRRQILEESTNINVILYESGAHRLEEYALDYDKYIGFEIYHLTVPELNFLNKIPTRFLRKIYARICWLRRKVGLM